jgi:hypothetical protein
MTGMKITLDAAMRARDVSRPTPDQEAAAASSELALASGRGQAGRVRRSHAPDRPAGQAEAIASAPAGGTRVRPGPPGAAPRAAGPSAGEAVAPAGEIDTLVTETGALADALGRARVRRRSRRGRRSAAGDAPTDAPGSGPPADAQVMDAPADQGTGGSLPESS